MAPVGKELTAGTFIPVTDIHLGTIGTWIDNIRAIRDDMPIIMREMIDSLIGSLRSMKGMMAGTTTGTMAGLMTIRLIVLSQESRVSNCFQFLPFVLLYVQ
ncbi:hypothetical protein PR202_gb23110 [Eleusine coracana subsp. coracana]|uniref:Uncharacterized protein n=1 Tax=Eleusine coracana subsp. coracana TaxID=191504 RepID=A0AAV5FFG6_ELECO|nr:hypothetical protein PR202_gb23110 [Eleusine coracana subsp. coracana]